MNDHSTTTNGADINATPQPAGPVRMSDIARAAGVSAVTVSRTINHPEMVSEATRTRIVDVMDRMGYVPDRIAGSLVTRRSYAVGVVIPTVTNSLFADTILGMTEVLEPLGYQLMIGSSRYAPDVEQELVRTFLARRSDAVVLTGVTHTDGTRRLLTQAQVPVIEMWNLCETPIDSIVGFSNFEAARQMTHHLAERGYRHIGFLGGHTADNDRTTQREAGYKAALAELGRDFVPARIERGTFDFRCGAEALRNLRARCPDVDAVCTASDILAVGAVFECMRQGWRVPDDIAVAGLDDAPIARELVPALTTVRLPRHAMGRKIGEIIRDRLQGTLSEPQRWDLGFEIVGRDSA